ncbi:hypothetical protein Tco_0505444 [Tanacetum coccineum]
MSTLAENRPPMLEKGGYDTWKSPNEAMGIAAVTRMQTFTDLTPEEKIRKDGERVNGRFLELGWNLEEIHVTWAHLEKKRTRLQTYTNDMGSFREETDEIPDLHQDSPRSIYLVMVSGYWRQRHNIADLK